MASMQEGGIRGSKIKRSESEEESGAVDALLAKEAGKVSQIKQAMPSWDGRHIILHAGCENFGKGSFDSFRRMHSSNYKMRNLIPVRVRESNSTRDIVIDRFPLRLFEN